jgi:DNA mismatch repair ATPase MutL
MTNEERKKFSDTLLRELLDRLGANDVFRRQLEGFSNLPPGRVADRLVKQFESLMSAQMRDLLINLIEQDIRAEQQIASAMKEEEEALSARREKQARQAEEARRAEEARKQEEARKEEKRKKEEEARKQEEARAAEEAKKAEESKKKTRPAETERPARPPTPPVVPAAYEIPPAVKPAAASIMEHFGTREQFPTAPMDIPLAADDWLYLYAFCYAPETSGKGVPSKKLALKAFDRKNDIFLLDYGDIRFYVSKLTASDYITDKGGKPTLDPQMSVWFKYDHEKILNLLRTSDVIVPINHWSIFRGLGEVTRMIEDRYVDLLRTLIDAHDATEWEVEIFGFDDHIIKLPAIAQEGGKVRTTERESRHAQSKTRDIKHVERLVFREKTIAQEIHSNLLYYAQKGKLDHMIRLDSAFMNDWKSILVCRYTVGKDKRRKFCEGINSIYETYKEYDLMVRVINPSAFIRLSDS